MIKVLNLYAGIGGNRKLWTDVDVTAVELNPEVAKIYQDFFPNDKVIVEDAHEYLLNNYKDFDFIWSSPPCPTHSRFNTLNNLRKNAEFPDMKLYEEIIFLKHWHGGKYCVENVVGYYEPLIPPRLANNHYFWANFYFPILSNTKRGIRGDEFEYRESRVEFDLKKYDLPRSFKKKILNNCVEPEIGLIIFSEAFKRTGCERPIKQVELALSDSFHTAT